MGGAFFFFYFWPIRSLVSSPSISICELEQLVKLFVTPIQCCRFYFILFLEKNFALLASSASTAFIWPFLFQLHHLLLFWNRLARESLKVAASTLAFMFLAFCQTNFAWILAHILKQNTGCRVAATPGWGYCDVYSVVHFFQRWVCGVFSCLGGSPAADHRCTKQQENNGKSTFCTTRDPQVCLVNHTSLFIDPPICVA